MTEVIDTTMASSEDADSSFKPVARKNKSKRLKAAPEEKIAVERTHSFTIRAYFPSPPAKTKFNPIASMRAFLVELLKHEPSITIVNTNTKEQLVLATDSLPSNEKEFKNYFSISTDTRAATNQQRIVIGCAMMSERTIQEIKYDGKTPQFMPWLKQTKTFLESDSLGVQKTAAVGYLTKIHPQYTNRVTLKTLLQNALEDIMIDPKLALELDPTLQEQQNAATNNGDMFITAIPPFEVYKTHISHGIKQDKVETELIGIKCAAPQARLLKEFFSQLASPVGYEKQIGMFIPTGAVHLLGREKYINLLKENNAFIDTVTTIPVGDFQHETLDIPFSLDNNTDIDQTTLQEVIEDQTWCINVERTKINNKVMITTTKNQLENARKWLDETLPDLYETHIADKLDVTTLHRLSPRRLDKPVLTAASTAYADMLKTRTTTTPPTTQTGNKNMKPPRTKKFTPVDMTFDEQNFPTLTTNATKSTTPKKSATSASSVSTTTSQTSTITTNPVFDYKKELARLSVEIETTLKQQFEALFAQMETKLDTFIKQCNERYEEQERTNETVTQQLKYIVDNTKKYLKLATSPATTNSPSPRKGDGHS